MNDPYRSIVQISRDFITLIDREGRYKFANKAYLHAFGKKSEEIVGRTVEEIWGRARYEASIEDTLQRCLNGEEVRYLDEFPFGESMKYVEVLFFPFREEEDGPVTHALVISHDISRLGELETRLMAYEFRDPATGLFNRRSMDIVVDREIQKVESGLEDNPRVLITLAIENLSLIRRQHGAGIATHIVENTGLRLKKHLGDDVPLFRCESDELGILLTNFNNPEDLAPLAESINTVVSMPYPKGLHEIRPDSRLGVALYPRDADNRDNLIVNSEAALNSAREQNISYQFYDGELHARSVDKQQLIAQLRLSLFEDRFELYFQPIVDPIGCIKGAECLLRWHHPEKGLLLPDSFIPLAVETGLNMEMEKQVIFSAARHLARWKEYGIYLSINLSARVFESDSLIDSLETALERTGVKSERLRLEITESEALSSTAKAMNRIKELVERGFKVYIDDFGTGQSSLRYLKDLQASVLKIDKAFVDGIDTNEENRRFLEHMIDLVKDRQRHTVIEGVENAAQAVILAGLEADALQGFYFSPPINADAFEALLKRGGFLPAEKK